MKQLILLFLIASLVSCSPQTQSVDTPEAEDVVSNELVNQPESTPEISLDINTVDVSIIDAEILEDEFTASTAYGDVSFGEAIFTAKCEFCLIFPDGILMSETDLASVYGKAIYYANGEVSPEGYLFTTIQDNEWNTLTINEIYHVIAYLKANYDAELSTVSVASIATTEPEITPETMDVVENTDETSNEETNETTEDNPIVVAVANADPIVGEQLFTMNFVTPCNSCHLVDSESMLVGPGLLNISDRAGSRIADMSAEEYLYNSIVHPNDFIVDGFAAAMPESYDAGLTDDEIYALVAYLMTLGQ